MRLTLCQVLSVPSPNPMRKVSGSRSDKSPPLTEIKPAERKPGRRVHPVKPIPRPKPDATDDPAR